MRTTKRKGDIATTRGMATFTAMGFDVSIPVTESAAYDLVGRRAVTVMETHPLGAVAESG